MINIELLEYKANELTTKIKLEVAELVQEQNKVLEKYKHLKEGK